MEPHYYLESLDGTNSTFIGKQSGGNFKWNVKQSDFLKDENLVSIKMGALKITTNNGVTGEISLMDFIDLAIKYPYYNSITRKKPIAN